MFLSLNSSPSLSNSLSPYLFFAIPPWICFSCLIVHIPSPSLCSCISLSFSTLLFLYSSLFLLLYYFFLSIVLSLSQYAPQSLFTLFLFLLHFLILICHPPPQLSSLPLSSSLFLFFPPLMLKLSLDMLLSL